VKWDNPDTYCYPGTTVLRNHLNLTDAAELASRQQLYAARDRAVMCGDSAPLAALFASILPPL